MADVMLGSADKGRVVEVGMAGRVMLQLPERPSTGYRWELQANGESLALETDSYVPGGSLQPGAGGLHSFCFRPRTPGETILRLQLRQPWDAASPAAETYEVTLRVVPDGAK